MHAFMLITESTDSKFSGDILHPYGLLKAKMLLTCDYGLVNYF